MEEYLPGRTENLHDYLIPTFGDMPEITCILVEDPEPLGPYGAKGVGEHSLIGTAPAIFGGIEQATGVRPRETPATPARLLALLREQVARCRRRNPTPRQGARSEGRGGGQEGARPGRNR